MAAESSWTCGVFSICNRIVAWLTRPFTTSIGTQETRLRDSPLFPTLDRVNRRPSFYENQFDRSAHKLQPLNKRWKLAVQRHRAIPKPTSFLSYPVPKHQNHHATALLMALLLGQELRRRKSRVAGEICLPSHVWQQLITQCGQARLTAPPPKRVRVCRLRRSQKPARHHIFPIHMKTVKTA
eukprot:Blabericola_migrator_1__2387@NODE_166_length_12211_cov_61_370142_g144_i0_p6_GENE_NODE_166_length_12211_cov_61_370142_g144_i0NODE_166_length_12211_cov_61_370142_g144_i0_p6_ORF_typecomplete_len182_score13_62_NODE_166_length_12211_cov_61_370142_g144_i023082853